MATSQRLNVFPSTVPTIALPNPHKKRASTTTIPLVVEESDIPEVPQISTANAAVVRLDSISNSDGVVQKHTRFQTGSIGNNAILANLPPPPSSPPPQITSHPKIKTSPTPSNGASSSSSNTLIPDPPSFRSLFPVFDPTKPLNQQNYIPQIPVARYSGFDSGSRRGSDIGPRGLFKTSSSMLSQEPSSRLESSSTLKELEKLWAASHGAEPDPSLGSFKLQMKRLVALGDSVYSTKFCLEHQRLASFSAQMVQILFTALRPMILMKLTCPKHVLVKEN